jgi:hypothetical protein
MSGLAIFAKSCSERLLDSLAELLIVKAFFLRSV